MSDGRGEGGGRIGGKEEERERRGEVASRRWIANYASSRTVHHHELCIITNCASSQYLAVPG